MRVGIGLPATIPKAPAPLLLEWARRADVGPFSCLGCLDRVVYDNYEVMTSLAAAAAVTSRVTLASSIVIAPLRSAALLAKEAASINALSGGRLVLGVGLGAREDDYTATGSPYRGRGSRLTDQLGEMRAVWERAAFGPKPAVEGGRPRLLVGGSGGLAASRAARYGDGFIHNGGPPRAFVRWATEAQAAWQDLGRPGRPELWSMAYFQLGRRSDQGRHYLLDYYAFTGPFAEKIAAGLLTNAASIRGFARDYEAAGCDELILFPTVADIKQLDRLADVLG
jgi:alkanesulfonate monooxygenase SsuD/methylene tetrahydromethanopterin reductase-like flavin-dependent oxidoreductase (luciferase family)